MSDVPSGWHRVPPSTCPYCLVTFDEVSSAVTASKPRPGDVLICTECARWSIILDDGITRRMPTTSEDVRLNRDADALRARSVVVEILLGADFEAAKRIMVHLGDLSRRRILFVLDDQHRELEMDPIEFARVTSRLVALGLIEKRQGSTSNPLLRGMYTSIGPSEPGYEESLEKPAPRDPTDRSPPRF